MEEKLNIAREEEDGYLCLRITGRIDGYWSGQLGEYFDKLLRAGDYMIALDLSAVNYMSSLGIRVLVKYSKQFKHVNGRFGILASSPGVEEVLNMAGLNTILKWEMPEPVATAEGYARKRESDGFVFTIGKSHDTQPMVCQLVGDPAKLRSEGYAAEDCRKVVFGKNHYGIGLGAIGSGYEDCKQRFGEFVALGNAVVYAPAGRSGGTDYMQSSGNFVPAIEMAYGILFDGEFGDFVRFAPEEPEHAIKFSTLISNLFAITGHESFVMLMLAETAGLVGFSLNQSPVAGEKEAKDLFSFPAIKENINFTSEPEYRDMMTITTGIASRGSEPALMQFTRPMGTEADIHQHFHAAVFLYDPIKKSAIDIDETIAGLFEQEKVRGVLHLARDTRDYTGAGESEFKSGICWIGKVETITKG